MSFFAAIGYNLANLLRFSGRQTRAAFWWYALAVVLVSFVASFALLAPMVTSSMAKMQRFAANHPDQATVTQGPGSYSIQIHGNHPELMPDFGAFAGGFALVAFAIVVLLAAAVVRRLHDRGRSGWWGIMPLPFLALGLVAMQRLFAAFQSQTPGAAPDPAFFQFFGLLFANNLLYLGTLIALIVMLSQPSDLGPNGYGPRPAA